MPEKTKSSSYITPEGFNDLKAQLKKLWLQDRPEMTKRLSAAAALGDRSENADYSYCKRQLGLIDRQIRYLDARLDEVTVVYDAPKDQNVVYFGAIVDLESDAETSTTYRIVGSDETHLDSMNISVASPLARALIGSRLGEEVTVRRPKGEHSFRVTQIRYR